MKMVETSSGAPSAFKRRRRADKPVTMVPVYNLSSFGVMTAIFLAATHSVSSFHLRSTTTPIPTSSNVLAQRTIRTRSTCSRPIRRLRSDHELLLNGVSLSGSIVGCTRNSHFQCNRVSLFSAGSDDGDEEEDDRPQVPSSFSEDVGRDFDAFLDDIISRKQKAAKRSDPSVAAIRPPAPPARKQQIEAKGPPVAENSGDQNNSDDMRKLLEQQQAQIQMLLEQNQEQMKVLQEKNQALSDQISTSDSTASSTVADGRKPTYEASDARMSMSTVPSQLEFNPQEDDSSFVSSDDLGITPPEAENVAPLRAMLFIDGTNLYYSTFGRQRVIGHKFGNDWPKTHKIDWNEWPRVICEALQEQIVEQGWSARPVEIVRACVFTAYKKSTGRKSDRVQMFEDMSNAGYDVHIMEATGDVEKCVDIQLATEILHYATVPKAYDIAILLSGDKDFLPALIRTRQKGKRVAIVASKVGCNQAFFDTPNIKDFDMIFWDDHLDRLVKPLTNEELEMKKSAGEVSDFIFAKLLRDMIKQFGDEQKQISSRDIGRCLKQVPFTDSNMLELMKESHRSIRLFLQEKVPDMFTFHERPWDTEAQDFEFWLGLTDNADSLLADLAKKTEFSDLEKEFLREYLASRQDTKNTDAESVEEQPLELPSDLTIDYSTFKVTELKERCRERGLPVSGTKAVLLERVQADVEEEKNRLEEKHKENMRKQGTIRPVPTARLNFQPSFQMELEKYDTENIDPGVKDHLIALIKEYLQASGGRAGSRDIGRYLAVNKAFDTENYMTALQEMKKHYGSFVTFIMANSDTFSRGKQHLTPEGKEYGFPVWERKEGDVLLGRSAYMEDIPPPPSRFPRGRPGQRRRYSGGRGRGPGRGPGRGQGRGGGRGPGRGGGRSPGRGRYRYY